MKATGTKDFFAPVVDHTLRGHSKAIDIAAGDLLSTLVVSRDPPDVFSRSQSLAKRITSVINPGIIQHFLAANFSFENNHFVVSSLWLDIPRKDQPLSRNTGPIQRRDNRHVAGNRLVDDLEM